MENHFLEEAKKLKWKGKLEEALCAYREAIKLEPNNQDVYRTLGHFIQSSFPDRLERLEEALDAYRQIINLTSNYNTLAYQGITNVLKKVESASLISQPPYSKIIFLAGRAGLCNRLRSLCSCLCLSYFWEIPLLMCWYPDEACNCYFEDLYEPVCDSISPEGIIKQFQAGDDRVLYINKIEGAGWFYNQFLKTYADRDEFRKRYLFFVRSMKVKPHLLQDMEQFIKDIWQEEVIGLHIRRTDFLNAVNVRFTESEFSSDEKFVRAIEREVDRGCNKFFLATDNEDTKKSISDKFPGKIISYCKTFSDKEKRHTSVGDALVDLYLLSKCKKIIGSYSSSFSKYAAQLGKVPLIYP